jgi:hypothetical protein
LELGEEEMTELEKIIQLAMRGAVNRLVADQTNQKELKENALKAKRDALNSLEKANFQPDEENVV